MLKVSPASATEGDAVGFTVTQSVANDQQVTVRYATSSGTATSGTDFTQTSGTLTFAPNATSKTVNVSTTDDASDEEIETFPLTLSSPTNASLGDATATGTIDDNDAMPVLTPSSASAAEGDAVDFTLSLSPASERQVTVQYATASGTATSGTDFTAASGTLTFAAGTTSETVSVSTTADETAEPNETFWLTLSSPRNATLALDKASVTGTILEDGLPALRLTVDDSATEGDAITFTIRWAAATGEMSAEKVRSAGVSSGPTATVEYGTASGTATSGTDSTAASGTLTFATGSGPQTVSVQTAEDGNDEEDETFALTLSNPVNATLDTSNATVTATIADDDDPPTVRGTLNFDVSLSVESGKQVTVDYSTSSETATSGISHRRR